MRYHGVLLFCDQSNRGYLDGVRCNFKKTEQFPMGSKLYVAINGNFAYDGRSEDTHSQSIFWGYFL